MTTRLVMSFAWMVILAALSSSSASSLLNETRIEAFDTEQFINKIRGIQDGNQIQSRAVDIKKYRGGTKTSPIQCPDELRIAAFNIEALGEPKFNDNDVMKIISRIISRYHVILIQEVIVKGAKITELVDKINELMPQSTNAYTAWTSEALGSSDSYKETYLFLIRNGSGISVEDTYQFDQKRKLFERAPFSLRLKCSDIEFVLTAIHTKPHETKTKDEIMSLLGDVYQAISNTWNETDNILMMGDLNTGYISNTTLKKLKQVADRNGQAFYWPFHKDAVGGNNIIVRTPTTICSGQPHDGFIITQNLSTKLVDGSAEVFNFHEKYAKDFKTRPMCCISDHYPIELTLKLKGAKRPHSPSTGYIPTKKPNAG